MILLVAVGSHCSLWRVVLMSFARHFVSCHLTSFSHCPIDLTLFRRQGVGMHVERHIVWPNDGLHDEFLDIPDLID